MAWPLAAFRDVDFDLEGTVSAARAPGESFHGEQDNQQIIKKSLAARALAAAVTVKAMRAAGP